jgi:hypothetical protein
LAKSKEVEAERFTSLDRMIERHLDNGKIDVSPSKPSAMARMIGGWWWAGCSSLNRWIWRTKGAERSGG